MIYTSIRLINGQGQFFNLGYTGLCKVELTSVSALGSGVATSTRIFFRSDQLRYATGGNQPYFFADNILSANTVIGVYEGTGATGRCMICDLQQQVEIIPTDNTGAAISNYDIIMNFTIEPID